MRTRQTGARLTSKSTSAAMGSRLKGAAPARARKMRYTLLHNRLTYCFNGAAPARARKSAGICTSIKNASPLNRPFYCRLSQLWSDRFAAEILTLTAHPSRNAAIPTRRRCFSIESFQQLTTMLKQFRVVCLRRFRFDISPTRAYLKCTVNILSY